MASIVISIFESAFSSQVVDEREIPNPWDDDRVGGGDGPFE